MESLYAIKNQNQICFWKDFVQILPLIIKKVLIYMFFIIDVEGFYCDYFFPNGKQKKVNCKLWICHWEVDGKRKLKYNKF